MTTIDTSTTVQVSDDCIATTIDEEVVILNQSTGEYQGLHGVGPRIFELAQEPTPVGTILETIRDEFGDRPASWRTEVLAFIEELATHHVIEVVDGQTQ